MNYYEIIDELVDAKHDYPTRNQYLSMYKCALSMMNKIKLSRFKAMYFGSMQVGNPEMYVWKNDKEFTSKYQSACIYVMRELYKDENKSVLAELTLSILYSFLAKFFDEIDIDKEAEDLLAENDKYCKDKELEGEFNG